MRKIKQCKMKTVEKKFYNLERAVCIRPNEQLVLQQYPLEFVLCLTYCQKTDETKIVKQIIWK